MLLSNIEVVPLKSGWIKAPVGVDGAGTGLLIHEALRWIPVRFDLEHAMIPLQS